MGTCLIEMKAGDMVHVPSHVTLTMTVSDGELSYIKPFLTSVRKKALFINWTRGKRGRSFSTAKATGAST